jgi:hypothetical protein
VKIEVQRVRYLPDEKVYERIHPGDADWDDPFMYGVYEYTPDGIAHHVADCGTEGTAEYIAALLRADTNRRPK